MLKWYCHYCRTLEMSLINCEIRLLLTWSENFDSSSDTGEKEFALSINKTLCSVVTLSTEDNIKLLLQLESGFKRAINWNKYQSKVTDQVQKIYFDYLIDPSNKDDRNLHTRYFLPKVELKYYMLQLLDEISLIKQ